MKEKMCKDCLEIFPATAEYFYKVTIKKNGKVYLWGSCKKCARIKAIDFYDKNRGRIIDARKAYYRKNHPTKPHKTPEDILAKRREYRHMIEERERRLARRERVLRMKIEAMQ